MNAPNSIQLISRSLRRGLSRHSQTILMGLGLAGFVTTVILAVKATPKAMKIIQNEEEFIFAQADARNKDPDPIDPLEVVKLTWRCYIPTLMVGTTSMACIIGANSVANRKSAALATLLAVSETTLNEYQAKVVEKLGKKKEEGMRDEISAERMEKHDPSNIFISGKGDYLCYDAFSGRYFRSNIETIRRAENEFNAKLLRDGWACLNDFYERIGLESIEVGNGIGWHADKGIVDLRYSTKQSKSGEPCLILDYRVQPKG